MLVGAGSASAASGSPTAFLYTIRLPPGKFLTVDYQGGVEEIASQSLIANSGAISRAIFAGDDFTLGTAIHTGRFSGDVEADSDRHRCGAGRRGEDPRSLVGHAHQPRHGTYDHGGRGAVLDPDRPASGCSRRDAGRQLPRYRLLMPGAGQHRGWSQRSQTDRSFAPAQRPAVAGVRHRRAAQREWELRLVRRTLRAGTFGVRGPSRTPSVPSRVAPIWSLRSTLFCPSFTEPIPRCSRFAPVRRSPGPAPARSIWPTATWQRRRSCRSPRGARSRRSSPATWRGSATS